MKLARALFAWVGLAAGCVGAESPPPVAPRDTQAADDCVSEVPDRLGRRGPYAVRVTTLPHPSNAPMSVIVYSPDASPGPHPVIFFAHAFNVFEPERYAPLLERLASNGAIAVFSPYSSAATVAGDHTASYDQLWDGFAAAVDALEVELRMDVTQIGFIGHSYGGGATPAMAWRALTRHGWGSASRFLLIMAPWQVLEMDPDLFAQIPPDTRILIQVYDDDDTNDHRFAIEDIWRHLAHVPRTNKDYVLLGTAQNGDCRLPADHGVPMISGGRYGKLDAYDAWAVWRRADALVRCTFESDELACAVALGQGDPRQANMGLWKDGHGPLPALVSMDPPEPRNCGPGESCTYRR